MKKKELKTYLKSRNYEEVRNETSRYFGDYLEEFSSQTVKVRLSSSKSFEMLDVCSVNEPNNWYDVALVKALVNKENSLNKVSSFNILADFLVKEHDQIETLFSPDHFPDTKSRLEKLEKQRVSQMFPNL